MKLAIQETYHIEKYLLEQDLISLEFYEEMLDHFTASVLDYKTKGNDFETAFILTRNSFIGIQYSRGFGYSEYAGIKALEQERLTELERKFKSERDRAPFSLFRSKRWFLWLAVTVLFIVLAKVFGIFVVQLLSTLIVCCIVALILYYSLKAKVLSNGLLGRWSKFMFSSLSKRKSTQLQPNFRLYVLMKSFQMTLTVIPFLMILPLRDSWMSNLAFGWNFPSFTTIGMLGFSLVIYEHFIRFKKEYDKTNLEKA